MKSRTWLAAIVAACVIPLGCAQSACALSLPSIVSGDYVGEGYACRILLQGVGNTGQRGLELKCIRPNNEQTTGLVYGPQACPSEWYMVPLTQWGGGDQKSKDKALQSREFLAPDGSLVVAVGFGIAEKFPATWARIVDYDLQTATLRVGTFDALIVGGGVDVILNKRQAVVLTQPYAGCSAAAFKPHDRAVGL